MKERGHMTSDNHRTLPPSPSTPHSPHHSPPPHHDHRQNRKPLGGGGGGGSGEEDPWRSMPSRGADINLLANSLSTRLRKAARHKTAASSSSGTTPPTTTTSSGSRSAPPEESVRKFHRSMSKRDSQGQMPPSILKRRVSKEMAEQQQQQYLTQQRAGSLSPREGDAFHLPDVFLTRRWSSSAGQLQHLSGEEAEVFNNQYLDRPSPALAILGGRGVGGGGGDASTRTHVGNGQVAWVKRAGIFQPADKYASGRQTLHGEDQLFGRVQAVDYETVTLPSRADTDTPDSDLTSGWSSGKSSRRKGLKVSWKQPGDSEAEEDVSRHTDTAMSRRQRSAGTVHSEPGVYSFVKPKFNPGRSQVPSVGVKWKVPTPVVGRPPTDAEQDARTPENHHTGHHSPVLSTTTPTQYQPPPPSSSLSPQTQRVTFSGKQLSSPSSSSQEVRHPWRALYPRDVHPVTTAMTREGTSVSKTKWRVPSLRPVPAFTFIEDLMEAGARQWHPGLQQNRLATRATVDGQSMQDRLKDAAGSLSSKDPATTATVSNVSSSLDQDLETSSPS